MKKLKIQLLIIVICLSLLLSGCSFLSEFGTVGGFDNSGAEAISSFDFVTDSAMVLNDATEDKYYRLTLHPGENYQIKTTVDEKLGDDYYLKYTTNKDTEGKFTISDTGMIETNSSLEENQSFVVNVDLYKKGSTGRIAREYFIFSLLVGEYANIVLTNDNLTYDDATHTYAMTLSSGNHYQISYSISYNTAYVLSFELANPDDSAYLTVNESGYITTQKTSEDKIVKIKIRLTGANGTLQAVFLDVTLKGDSALAEEFKVTNQTNAKEILDNDILTIYENSKISFDASYGTNAVTPNITCSNSEILLADNTTLTLTAIAVGTSEVTFAYGDKQITISVNVVQDSAVSLSAEQDGGDFIIINGELKYLGNLYVTYESGKRVELTDNSVITSVVSDCDGVYKTVAFTYAEDGSEVTVSYRVRYYVSATYDGQSTAYDNNDLFNNGSRTVHVLPNEGTVKLLVIPVWFEDSDAFFNESQQEELLEDIEYTVNGDRPNTELKSLKQYYEAQSYGAITMDITVSEFYRSDTSYEDYSDYEEDKIMNTYGLGTDAIRWYFDSHTNEAFEEYDLNSDGYLDGVILYYAANYYGAAGDVNKTTAYEIDTDNTSTYAFNTLSFCSLGGLYGLNRDEPTVQLTSQDLSETFSRAFRSSARTIIHEVGHMFGNQDLYEDQFAEERYSPAGGFVMQDRNYGSHDPYHVNRIGWSKPQVSARRQD